MLVNAFICFKSFSLSQYLKEHMFIHTGQKPFECDFPGCTRAFRQAGKLSLHKKTHTYKIFSVQKCEKDAPAMQPLDAMSWSETSINECSAKKSSTEDFLKEKKSDV